MWPDSTAVVWGNKPGAWNSRFAQLRMELIVHMWSQIESHDLHSEWYPANLWHLPKLKSQCHALFNYTEYMQLNHLALSDNGPCGGSSSGSSLPTINAWSPPAMRYRKQGFKSNWVSRLLKERLHAQAWRKQSVLTLKISSIVRLHTILPLVPQPVKTNTFAFGN